MKKIRNLLCRYRWSVRIVTTFLFILIVALNIITLNKNGSDYYLTWEAQALIGFHILCIVFFIAARAIIRFNEWQFRMWFTCEPPSWNQTKASGALKPLIEYSLTTLTASFDALDTIYTKLHSEAMLEGQKNTPTGHGHSDKYKEVAASMWFKREKAQRQFNYTRSLAIAFGFSVPHLQDYLDQIRASEQTQAVLAEPVPAAPATAPM